MKHAGILFLSRAKPAASISACGSFQLMLLLFDRIGPQQVEPWRVVWAGPAARRFWDAHQSALVAGTALQVELERARIHTLSTRPPMAEVHARVISAELAPARHSSHPAEQAHA